MDLGLKGKIALVTGAGSPIGFGKGIALILAGAGCDIAAVDIDYEGVKGTVGEKAAIIVFTRGLAKEVISSSINVNSVAPGVGDTNFLRSNFPAGELEKAVATVPLGRATTPEEVGNMVAYLASDISRNLVGQTIYLDGGHSIQ
jgi:NAD(P)-dependent dehydrogenase (short-subunit alcohol dehydrogenase family)